MYSARVNTYHKNHMFKRAVASLVPYGLTGGGGGLTSKRYPPLQQISIEWVSGSFVFVSSTLVRCILTAGFTQQSISLNPWEMAEGRTEFRCTGDEDSCPPGEREIPEVFGPVKTRTRRRQSLTTGKLEISLESTWFFLT